MDNMIARTSHSNQRSDFDEVIDRRSTNSMKWDYSHAFLKEEECDPDLLPMWVADMDFRTAPVVRDALKEAIDHGVFGYTGGPSRSYLKAVVEWQAKRFGWDVSSEWIVPVQGVIASLKTAIQAFSNPGDSVLIQPPVYGHFQEDVLVNGRRPTLAPLKLDGDRYVLDPVAFERAILPNTKLFLLCNPHNPTGNVWTPDELRTMGEICARHGVLVVADEIHQDFIINTEKRHTPFASLGERFSQNSITCTAPSKTFNLAGMHNANVFIPNPRLRDEFKRQIDRNAFGLVNTLGMVAGEAAYVHGEPWVEAMLAYVRENHRYFASEIHKRMNGVRVLPADSLYLAWMDFRELGMNDADLNSLMLTKAKIWFDAGRKFGMEGTGFLRSNLACSRATVDEALTRMQTALKSV